VPHQTGLAPDIQKDRQQRITDTGTRKDRHTFRPVQEIADTNCPPAETGGFIVC